MAYHNLYWVNDRPGALTLETEAAKRAEQLAPDIPETYLALGLVNYANREFNKALAHFERAESLRPSGEAALDIGWTLRRTGKWQEALKHFEDARRLLPRSYLIWNDALGYTNVWLRRFDEAEQDYNQAISLAPNLTGAYVGKANVLLARNGDVDAAKQVMLEMSRRANMAEVAEFAVTDGLMFTSDLRLHPETFKEAFDAFESGPMERYRRIQPAVIAATHLDRALLIEATEGRRAASARYDSARVYYERIIRSNPQSMHLPYYHTYLGLAYAGLGRKEEAIREGREAVRIVPISKDALVGPEMVSYLAEIYMRCGEHEAAIDQIETMVSLPGPYMTVNILRIDPIWDPIRSNPRFKRLVEGN
jgi:serine/threonine-protein kinase